MRSLCCCSIAVAAQSWHIEPSVAVQETLTNNVNLTPSSTAQGDLRHPGDAQLTIDEKGPRTSLRRHHLVAGPGVHAHGRGKQSGLPHQSNLLGTVEGIEKFFYVEGAINVTQQFFNAVRSAAAESRQRNAEPLYDGILSGNALHQGITPGNIKYELRNNNIWANLSGAPIATNNSYTDEWKGRVSGPLAPFGWALDYDWTDVKFTDQRPTTTRTGSRVAALSGRSATTVRSGRRIRGQPDFRSTSYSGAIYGVGLQWNPNERTNVAGNWEHRFFGSSYLFSFDHRTPLSAIIVKASRDTTSYPQQFLSLPATGNVPLCSISFCSRAFPIRRSASTRSIRFCRTGACRTS